jgi:hypothetical protein
MAAIRWSRAVHLEATWWVEDHLRLCTVWLYLAAMALQNDLRKIIKAAEAQGWRHEQTQHWHLLFWPGFDPMNDKPCQIGTTPHTRGRALPNLRSCLRRHGFRE